MYIINLLFVLKYQKIDLEMYLYLLDIICF